MSIIPDSDKKIRAKISRYKSAFKKEKQQFGQISDGYGKRYLMFSLLLVLNDLKKFEEFIDWYDAEFPDDSGEPIQMFCRSILTFRVGKMDQANLELAETMLSNLYLLPYVLGEKIDKYDMWHSSNFTSPEFCEFLPDQVLTSITEQELNWIESCYHSDFFVKIRTRYIKIYNELQSASDIKERSRLLAESSKLLKSKKVN